MIVPPFWLVQFEAGQGSTLWDSAFRWPSSYLGQDITTKSDIIKTGTKHQPSTLVIFTHAVVKVSVYVLSPSLSNGTEVQVLV
jgi:hypothetical protein